MMSHKDKKRKLEKVSDNHHSPYSRSVVKIYSTELLPNYLQPWKGVEASDFYGSGSVIDAEKGYILTCAHVANPTTEVFVRLARDTVKYPAKVLVADADCDLCIIQVSDSRFLEGVRPVTLGEFQPIGEKVSLVGYPFTSNELTQTVGTISSNEMHTYQEGYSLNLVSWTDASINGGNSGGPAFDENDNQVGVVFQAYDPDIAEKAGELIPIPVIRHFLKAAYRAIQTGTPYTGVPYFPVLVEKMEGSALRLDYRLDPLDNTGVLVRTIDPLAEVGGLRVDDVILSIDGHPILSDRTINTFPEISQRLDFNFLITQKQMGESIKVKISRAGKKLDLKIPLLYRTDELKLVSKSKYQKECDFFIGNGLCFLALNSNFLVSEDVEDYTDNNHLTHELASMVPKTFQGQEEVVVSTIFQSTLTSGNDQLDDERVIDKVNEVPIKNLRHLVEIVANNNSKNLSILFKNGQRLILHKFSPEEENEIADLHEISKRHSDSLADLFKTAPKQKINMRK